MKKLLISSMLCVAFVSASAQFEIRPFTGVNFSNVTRTPDQTTTQAKLGAQIGGSLMIGNKFHFAPGIALFWRATEYSFPGNVNTDQRTSGVIVPLHVGYRFIDATTEPFFNFRVFGGPSIMFLNSTKFDNGLIDESVDWKNSQWGFNLGTGFDISVFFLDLGYEIGMSKTGGPESGAEGLRNIRNNTFFVNVGLRLSLSR